MKKSKFTESQIIKAIKEFVGGRSVDDVARELKVFKRTIYTFNNNKQTMRNLKKEVEKTTNIQLVVAPFVNHSKKKTLTHYTRPFVVFLFSIIILSNNAFAGEPFYSNYTAGNGFDAINMLTIRTGALFGGSKVAAPIKIPPDCDYDIDFIELTVTAKWSDYEFGENTIILEIWQGNNPIPPADLGTAVPVASFPPYFLQGSPPPTGPKLIKFIPSGTIILQQGIQYWLVVRSTTYFDGFINSVARVDWHQNNAGVTGTTAGLPYYTYCDAPGACLNSPNQTNIWRAGPSTGVIPVFRVEGTPVPTKPIKPSYSTYTAPSTGGSATIYLEVICPPNNALFTMPVSATIPPNQTPAQICQILSTAINNCGACPCWGSCPATAPYGFIADCSGSVLRVRNLTPGLCPGAFVCADHVSGLTKFAAKKQLLGIQGEITLEIRGIASGLALDAESPNMINVIRTLRSDPTSEPQVTQAQIMLSPGMEATQVIERLAQSFSSKGDSSMRVQGNRLTFLPPGTKGNYDVEFLVNDTGFDYAFSPAFEFSFFDYVKRFTAVSHPTFFEWCMIVLILLFVLGTIYIRRSKKPNTT